MQVSDLFVFITFKTIDPPVECPKQKQGNFGLSAKTLPSSIFYKHKDGRSESALRLVLEQSVWSES